MIYWFIGYPGVGKDYCAKKLSQLLVCPHIDADDFLTKENKQSLIAGKFGSHDRLQKLNRICEKVKILLETNDSITVADSLPDQASRNFVVNYFGKNVRFILVKSSDSIHHGRLMARSDHFFTHELIEDYIKNNWQEIDEDTMSFSILINEHKSEAELIKALQELI